MSTDLPYLNKPILAEIEACRLWIANCPSIDKHSAQAVWCQLPGGHVYGVQYANTDQNGLRLWLPVEYAAFRKAVHPKDANARKRKAIRVAFQVPQWGDGAEAYLSYHGPVNGRGKACSVAEAGADPTIYPWGPTVGVHQWTAKDSKVDAYEDQPYERIRLSVCRLS